MKKFSWLLPVMIAAVFLTACGAQPSATPEPAATAEPATATLLPPPSATPEPAATPQPATATPVIPPSATPEPAATPQPATATPVIPPSATPEPAATPQPPPDPSPAASCPEHGYCNAFEVGGQLTAAAWLDADRMYLADYEGRLWLLNINTGEIATVLTGLNVPQGLTVLDGRLYVTDMGNVCRLQREIRGDENHDLCNYRLDGDTMEFLSRASAQILSYSVDASGQLSDRQIVADRIISYTRDHSPNGLTNDGEYVYVSIGHPQSRVNSNGYFIKKAAELAAHQRRTDLMGTIARFRPSNNEIEVYATGLRNVYGISIAPDGTVYGADNDEQDGLATEGHLEELNAIVQGGFYGFPFWGTREAPPEANVAEPVAVLPGTASTFAHASEDGVYVAYLALGGGEKTGFVIDRFDYATWTPEWIFIAPSYITAILEQDGLLYAASFSGKVHVINPAAAPVRIQGPFLNDNYVDEVIAAGGLFVATTGTTTGYDVYISGRRVVYVKSPCSPTDTELRFFLHIDPVNPGDLPESRREYGFDNLDFWFNEYGWRSGGSCRAVRELPDYDIDAIRTGQSVLEETGYRRPWRAEYRFQP